MITTEEIATRVYAMLQASEVKNFISGVIDYERNDYTKEDVIIVPHTIDGEASVRYGQINVNIHVPDKVIAKGKGKAVRKVQQLFRQVRPSRQPVGLSQLAEQVNKQQVGQVGDYQLFHFRLHRDSPLSLNFSLARSALRAAAFSLLAAMSLRIEGRSSRCNFLAVNSLNACSMLSASLALKITM